jgi:hypothetical protein
LILLYERFVSGGLKKVGEVLGEFRGSEVGGDSEKLQNL